MKTIVLLILANLIATSNYLSQDNLMNYINKPIQKNLIDNLIGAESIAGQCSGFVNDDKHYLVSIYSNWKESSKAVIVLSELQKNNSEVILLDYITIDYRQIKEEFNKTDIATGMNNSPNNVYIIIYDSSERDEFGRQPEYNNLTLKVWTIDIEKLKITQISPKNIKYHNDGYNV